MECLWELTKKWRKQFTRNVSILTFLFRATGFTSKKGHETVSNSKITADGIF
jgi:hypothetical protein